MVRFILIPLLFFSGIAWAGLAHEGRGVGEYGEAWTADPMHEFWDPARYHAPETERVEGVFSGEACLNCHEGVTPGIVKDWRESRHARAATPVLCPACHGGDHQALAMPTPAICGGCHPQRLEEMTAERRLGFPSHALAMERAMDSRHFADKPKAEVTACLQCHSVGSKCDSCHTRHRFSAAEARRPEACITCHSGPPHPDDATYFSSPHGQRYLKEGGSWDWNRALAEGPPPAPTCASCHMERGRHQVADKAVWRFGIREVNPANADNRIKRKRWEETCAVCHPREVAGKFFRELDEERRSTWKILYGVESLLKGLGGAGLLRPRADERPEYPMSGWWDRLWPRERIGFFQGQASAFYNVSALERDYFEMWYFTSLGAYKGMAHGAGDMARDFHVRLQAEEASIGRAVQRLREGGAVDGERSDLWREGDYTRFNRDRN